MLRTCLLTICVCACAAAQDPGFVSAFKAPAGTNEALKARVSGFYQAYVDGKFRKADEFVAEDSKDAFFSMAKKQYKSFEILDLYYADDFKKAKVITKVSTDVQTPRYGNMQMQPVVQTMWKFENGNWYWFDPSVKGTNSVDTPFGKMTFGPTTASGPTILGQKRISVEEVLHSVSADKQDVSLSPTKGGTQVVTVSNSLPGLVTVVVEPFPALPGLTVEAEKAKLGPGEKTPVRFEYKPSGTTPPYINVTLTVQETGQRFPIRIDFREADTRKN
jgi:hypothetical protein